MERINFKKEISQLIDFKNDGKFELNLDYFIILKFGKLSNGIKESPSLRINMERK